MQAAGAGVIATDTGIRARCGARAVKAFSVDVNAPYGPSRGTMVTAMLLAARGVPVHFDQEGLRVCGSDWIADGPFALAGDRIEAATMVMAAAATGGSVHLDNITPDNVANGALRLCALCGPAKADW
ncbi:hypothetical protein [Streptomyces sp. WELS2]|uniref:hypothetical protein n=1 Tax=Streptomyces sp. WELS2 TaxID=2749435 RepID=UPI0015F06CDF|nr:hypothetical protein [Streptomyces sp. WELS2]